MNLTVFYSWQSDLEGRLNRSFIQDALERAVKEISKSDVFDLEMVIDRDTFGMPGSPSIVESISDKIAKSDLFVCDVSIINLNEAGRPTPNPNVLFELGYASALLGWERIIMVQNVTFGAVDKLPFDLRGRRVVQYALDPSLAGKSEQRQLLKLKLSETFKQAFSFYSSNHRGFKEKVSWWGTWEMEGRSKASGGSVKISRVSSQSFFFKITIIDGARTGDIVGKASITTPHAAYARVQTNNNENCEIVFRRMLQRDSWVLEVEEGAHCLHFHGMGASFSGTYEHVPEALLNEGYLDETDMNELDRLMRGHFHAFLANFQLISREDDLSATTFEGWVKGLYTIMESIAVLGEDGALWGAFLDVQDGTIRLFSNVTNQRQSKPESLEKWLSRFPEREIVINENNFTHQPNQDD